MKVNWENDESNAPQAASGVVLEIAAAAALAYCHEPEQELDAERLQIQNYGDARPRGNPKELDMG